MSIFAAFVLVVLSLAAPIIATVVLAAWLEIDTTEPNHHDDE